MLEYQSRPSVCSLNLQITLHFNFLFSLVFVIVFGSTSIYKVCLLSPCLTKLYIYMILQIEEYEYNRSLQKYSLIPLLFIWLGCEAIRLHFGFSGNLKEKVGVQSFLSYRLLYYMWLYRCVSVVYSGSRYAYILVDDRLSTSAHSSVPCFLSRNNVSSWPYFGMSDAGAACKYFYVHT